MEEIIMLPKSLIQFLITEKIEEWPEWLPVIVHDIEDEGTKREWDEEQDIGVILKNNIPLNEEVKALKMIIERHKYRIVQLWNELSDFPIENELEDKFSKISDKSESANDDFRRIILEFMFEKPTVFTDSLIKKYIDDFPQTTERYPLLAERTDIENKPLVMIPEPSEHWKYSRLSIMKEGGKIWFPTHKNMRGKSTSLNTIPPKYREECRINSGWQNEYSFLPNDDRHPLTKQRQTEGDSIPGPNIIHWEHDFHPDRLKEALELSIDYLRKSEFVSDRPKICLYGESDIELGNLRILAAGEEVKNMIAKENAFKLPSLLNIAYMPEECQVTKGYEDKDGNTHEIHTFKPDSDFASRNHYDYYPNSNFSELKKGMNAWTFHLFNWDDNGKLYNGGRKERGKDSGDVWKARFNDEGDDEKFNYSILVRDLRIDHIMLEMAIENKKIMASALNINRLLKNEYSPIRGGLTIFEGYWSKKKGKKFIRELRFEIIRQSYDPNFISNYRYVNGEPRVTVMHSSFAKWSKRKLLGFSKESTYNYLESGLRGILDLVVDKWIPCNECNDIYVKLLGEINIDVVVVEDETFNWLLGVKVPSTVTNPWKVLLKELCKKAVNSPILEQKALLIQIDKIAGQVNDLDNVIKTGLRKIDKTIIDEFSELSKRCSGIGSVLREVMENVLLNLKTMNSGDIQKAFQGVNLCNWIYNYEEGKFIASNETGLTNRDIILVTPEEADRLFGWKGDRHNNSEGEWNSKGFGLKDGYEMVILEEKIVEKIEENTTFSRIEIPNLEQLREVKIESDNPKFQFIGTILTLNFFKSMDYSTTPESMTESLQNREKCFLVDSEVAKQNYAITIEGNLTIGPGGWMMVHHQNKYFLVYSKMYDLLWSLKLLKGLMKDCKIPDKILNFSMDNMTSVLTKMKCKDLIADNPKNEVLANALFGEKSEDSLLVKCLNPWSENEDESQSYLTRFTLDSPKDELLRERKLWENSEDAQKYLKTLQDNYKQKLESGNLWTAQHRALLEVMYNGRICILDGKQYFASDSDDTTDFDHPRYKTQISKSMIGGHSLEMDAIYKIEEQVLIGDTLITSADAREKMKRTGDPIRYDLVERFYEDMRYVVESVQWDNAGDWVLTDSVLKSPSDDKCGIWLHKLHHLHITGLYSAISELRS